MKYILFLGVILISCSPHIEQESSLSAWRSEVVVNRILDGDTFEFLINGEAYHVRVLDVDAYESKENARLEKQAEETHIKEKTALKRGLRAKALAEKLLLGKRVILLRDSSDHNFDVYNRLLRHVIVDGMRYDSILIKKKLGIE